MDLNKFRNMKFLLITIILIVSLIFIIPSVSPRSMDVKTIPSINKLNKDILNNIKPGYNFRFHSRFNDFKYSYFNTNEYDYKNIDHFDNDYKFNKIYFVNKFDKKFKTVKFSTASTDIREIDFSVIKEGSYNNIDYKQEIVIKNSEKLDSLWYEMFNDKNIPNIDFDENMVIAVFMGEKNTGGYSIQVKKIIKQDNKINVYFREFAPGKNCFVTQALTQPYQLVKLKDYNLPIKFIYDRVIREC